MDPRVEQYEAAEREARLLVRKQRTQFSSWTFEPDRDTDTPPAVMGWVRRFVTNLNALRKCRHGGNSQVHLVYGVEPNRGYCLAKCARQRARDLDDASKGRTNADCDFCGRHFPGAALAPVVFNVSAVVVRANICAECLTAGAEVPA